MILIVAYLAVFTFGGNGFQRQTYARGAPAEGQNAEPRSLLVQLLPLLLLFGFSMLSSLPNLFTTPPTPDPRFAFTSTAKYNTEMETGGLGVPYFVNKAEFASHPIIGAEMAKEGTKIGRILEEVITPTDASNGEKQQESGKTKSAPKTRKVVYGKGKTRGPALKKFEDTVERIYTQDLYADCRTNTDRKERRKEAEVGIFGIGTDWEKVKKIEKEVIPSCEELRRLGYHSRS